MSEHHYEDELSKDLAQLQLIMAELGGKPEFVAAGSGDKSEKRLDELVKTAVRLTEKYKDKPLKITGFSITLGAILINSSISVNFEH